MSCSRTQRSDAGDFANSEDPDEMQQNAVKYMLSNRYRLKSKK